MRVIVAARLSQKQRDGREGISIETQDKRSHAWAEREGHDVVKVVADTKSGTVAPWDRKHLKPWVTKPELMAQYDAVVAFKTDRLSRGDQEDFTRIEHWATEHGKRLIIVDGPQYPARDDSDYWQWAATKREARREWESIRERSMRTQAELRDRGALVGRYPWGYASAGEKYDRRMITTAEGEQYAGEAFTRIADGETLPAVAAWLRDRTNQEWHPRTVAAMIRNTTYRGEHRDASGRTIHKCPALVSGELWRRANANLDARPSSRRGQRNDLTTGAAMLSGMVYCANPDCTAGPDSPMYRIAPPGRPAVYRCSGRGAQRKGCGCNVDQASADALMDQAMSALIAPVLRPVFHPATGHQAELDDITQALRDLPAQELDEEAEDAERARLRAERRRLSDLPAKPAWTEHIATGETYGAKWARSDQAERRAWLRDAGFALYLGKPEYVLADPSQPGDQSARMDVCEDARALLVFRWTGDEDEGLLRGQSYGDPAEEVA